MNIEDVNAGFEDFHNIFMKKCTNCCSKKCTRKTGRKNKPISPWISHRLLQCINKKYKLGTNHLEDHCIATLEKYTEYKKCLQSILRKAKRNYFIGKIAKSGNDSRKMWKVANSLLRPCSAPPELPSKSPVNGETISGPESVANALGSIFCRGGKKRSKFRSKPREEF